MEAPTTLNHLAYVMDMRHKATTRPYHLLLTSTLSLTPPILQNICYSPNWNIFRRHLRDLGHDDRLNALAPLSQNNQHLVGYRALARLIAKGYFTTIFTTNIDSLLENALAEEGLEPSSRRVLIPGYHPDEQIVQALNYPTHDICIVKLHGSLYDNAIPPSFPDFFELRPNIRESVQRYLNQDIIIVGSITHDYDIQLALNGNNRSNIYYVHPHTPPADDQIIKVIEARGNAPASTVIDGQHGDFANFFSSLEDLLLPSTHTIQTSQNNDHLPLPSPQALKSSKAEPPLKADVLLVTVTEVETGALFAVLAETCGNTYKRCFIGDKTYYDLGIINGARIFSVQSEMGTTSPGASLLTIREGLQALAPSAIVMVGIAFGFDAKTQRIGDILVSQQLQSYEFQRYGSGPEGAPEISLRADLASASVRLLDRFRSGILDWQGPRVAFGLLLSGEKLIDNVNFRNHLLQLAPEAIGGEMEGTGLYAVAERYKVDWIIVKAISDLADGNKARNKLQRQIKAARNAAQFALHVLQKTELSLPQP